VLGPPSSTGELDLSTEAEAVITSLDYYTMFGSAMAGAGDIDGDGVEDVLIGAPGYSNGTAYIYLGPVSGGLLSRDADGSISSTVYYNRVGAAVDAMGDTDLDGYDDIVVGSEYAGAGLFLGSSSPGETDFAEADALIQDSESGSYFGKYLANVGDVDGDGEDDLVVGAPYATGDYYYNGRAHLFVSPLEGAIDASSSEFTWLGDSYSLLGSVGSIGDMDGDGQNELALGAQYASGGGGYYYYYLGATYLFRGSDLF
jgi:hypothetical protein